MLNFMYVFSIKNFCGLYFIKNLLCIIMQMVGGQKRKRNQLVLLIDIHGGVLLVDWILVRVVEQCNKLFGLFMEKFI